MEMVICMILTLFLIAGILTGGYSQLTSTGCGITKGCFSSPATCPGTDCDFFVSWTSDESGGIVLSMTGNGASTYIALGFSKSGIMRDSDVYACTSNNEVVRSRNTLGNANIAYNVLKGVSNVSVSSVDGRIECNFTRQASLGDGDETYFDLTGTNKYFIIMATSSGSLRQDGSIGYHENRIYDTQLYTFQDFLDVPIEVSTTTHVTVTTTQDNKITSIVCGISKGCFRQPEDCSSGSNCDFFVSWTSTEEGDIRFSMSGLHSATYIAIGFSKSWDMSDSDVYSCTRNREMVRSRNKEGNVNDQTSELKGVSEFSIRLVNGRIECHFTRKASLNDGDSTYFNLNGNNSYYIIMAKSSGSLKQDGNINQHAVDGRTKGRKTLVSFQTFVEIGAENDKLALIFQKSHGSLMVAAWILLASVGVTLARFYKDMWPKQQFCGKPVWFVMHVMFMTPALMCTVAGFVIIFLQKRAFLEYSEDLSGRLRFLHAVLGTIVTFLVIVNPIMSVFRPHPGEPRRFIFNWLHWSVGTTAQLIGLVTVCLGVGYRSARPLIPGLPPYLFWVVIVFLAYHFAIWVLFQVQSCMELRQDIPEDIPREGTAHMDVDEEEEDPPKPLGSSTMMGLLIIYFLGALLTAGFLIFAIVTVDGVSSS